MHRVRAAPGRSISFVTEGEKLCEYLETSFCLIYNENLYFPFPIPSTGTIIFSSFSILFKYEVAVTSEQPMISTTREFPKTSAPISSYSFNTFCFIFLEHPESKILCLKSLVSLSIQTLFFGLVPFFIS